MESWWHNSPGYISIDAQQLLLGILVASTLIPRKVMPPCGSLLGYPVLCGLCVNQPERKLADREKL